MPRIDNKHFYLCALEKYAREVQALHWTSKQSQEVRFDMLLELLPNTIDSLVDAGCGFGDFYTYMQNKAISLSNYTGIDTLEAMCEEARIRTHSTIIQANIITDTLPQAEYYVCSGAMNILTAFESQLFIRKCFDASQKGFVFNVLHGNKKSETYNYMTKDTLYEIADALDVKEIKIREDYMDNDITLGFFH